MDHCTLHLVLTCGRLPRVTHTNRVSMTSLPIMDFTRSEVNPESSAADVDGEWRQMFEDLLYRFQLIIAHLKQSKQLINVS